MVQNHTQNICPGFEEDKLSVLDTAALSGSKCVHTSLCREKKKGKALQIKSSASAGQSKTRGRHKKTQETIHCVWQRSRPKKLDISWTSVSGRPNIGQNLVGCAYGLKESGLMRVDDQSEVPCRLEGASHGAQH